MFYTHGEDLDLLMLSRLSVLTGKHGNYLQSITKYNLLFIITLSYLKPFKTNTLNYHRDKLLEIYQRTIDYFSRKNCHYLL